MKAGVEVWCYRIGKKIALDTPMDKFMWTATSFAADMERWLAQQRSIEAMLRKAQAGHVTGGRVFGYDNVRIAKGHVERRINEREANVVRDIYQRYADGGGFKQIAHALNAKKLPSPRAQRGRPTGWDPGTIRAVLKRPLYRGLIVYNRTTKRDTDGNRHRGRQPTKPETQWLKLPKPELRVIDEWTAERVDQRLAQRRTTYLRDNKGRLLGSPRQHGHNLARRLLSGFLACACGASYEAVKGYYVCSARRRKGPSVCPSAFSFPVEAVEGVFLDIVEGEMLASPSVIDQLVDAMFTEDDHADERAVLMQEQEQLAREIENLTKGIASGDDIPALAAALQERDRRLKGITAQLARPFTLPDRDVLKAALELRTADWRTILRGPHVQQARTVLQHIIDLPIHIFNEPKPKWVADGRPEGLTVGLVQSVASPPGFEPGFQP